MTGPLTMEVTRAERIRILMRRKHWTLKRAARFVRESGQKCGISTVAHALDPSAPYTSISAKTREAILTAMEEVLDEQA